VAIADERIGDARELLHEAVDLALQLGDRVGLSWYLGQFALVLVHESRPEDAGRIWGPSRRPPPSFQVVHGRVTSTGFSTKCWRSHLAFERGREAGRSLSLEEAAKSVPDRG
jgi:hypothetical protein